MLELDAVQCSAVQCSAVAGGLPVHERRCFAKPSFDDDVTVGSHLHIRTSCANLSARSLLA